MRRIAAYVLLPVLLLSGCAAPADPDTARESIQVIAMDTAMLITTYGERSSAAAYACEDTIRDLETLLSRTDPDSAVSHLNAAGTLEDSKVDLCSILSQAGQYYQETGGAFDVTVAPVVAAWGFAGGEEYRIPGETELQELLKLVDGSAVTLEGQTVALAPGQAVDLGGIAKGYAADRLIQVFNEYEVPRALAELGGNVLAWGDRPDGVPWRVGVQDPARPDEQNAFAGVLNLTDSFAVTSGDYQRYFEEGGRRYHHIIDPATGYPADSGLTSVTVVAGTGGGNGAMCDAYSTALFTMGEKKALEFWRSHQTGGDGFELVLITEDGRVVVTEGLADRFTPDESGRYRYETVS